MLLTEKGWFWENGAVVVRWLWDTRLVANQTVTGKELVLFVCDPEFISCGPIRSKGVRGPIGIEASLSWFESESIPVVIRIEANRQEVALCNMPVCRWVLDFDALGVGEAHVVATADFQNFGLFLQVSKDLLHYESDFDQDGFVSVVDGGDDCDDYDPFSHPGVPEPSFPICATYGDPQVLSLDRRSGDVTLFFAIRTPDNVSNIFYCDPKTHSLQVARVVGTTVMT